MPQYYLAIDIGASSGRHMLGYMEKDRLVLEEVYRFDNGMDRHGDNLYWNIDKIYDEIINGLKKCKEIGKEPAAIGIDTWGADYVLLDSQGDILGDVYGYRDNRTNGMDIEVNKYISDSDLYKRTGISKNFFNTIYQLMSVKVNQPDILDKADRILFISDYLHYKLTDIKCNEYTSATTGQLINIDTCNWDYELIDMLGFPRKIFKDISMPGTMIGHTSSKVSDMIGYDAKVILPCTHDTQSAILATPSSDDDYIYISSGTWSLLGIERDKADSSEISRINEFTNEGGYGGNICYLRNIMGLWMIQSIRRDIDKRYSFAQICDEAEKAKDFPSIVDVNDATFISPDNMIDAIRTYCKNTDQKIPDTLGEIATVAYASLARCYADTISNIESTTDKRYNKIHILGGGSSASYLNKLTARATGKKVYAGPSEATAIGNILSQMISDGIFKDKEKARECIARSFDIQVY